MYNIAGNAINIASRVMGLCDRNQIIFSDHAFQQLIDLVDDDHMDENFQSYHNVRIKHGDEISVYQYINPKNNLINRQPPLQLSLMKRTEELNQRMNNSGLGTPDFQKFFGKDRDEFLNNMSVFIDAVSGAFDTTEDLEDLPTLINPGKL